jgi:exonuclease III
MIMAETNVPLHQEDNIVLLDTFDFSQSIFDLHEPDIQIPSLSNDFTTPTKDINLKFKNYENLIKIAHVNSCSIPKHLHEIDKIVQETNMDVIGACETFISEHTPNTSFDISGYNFFHVDRDQSCRGGVGLYVRNEYPAVRIKLPEDLVQPEMCFVQITVGTVKMAVGVVYRSPLIPYSVFAAIHENIAFVTAKYEHCIIMGDMNIDHLKIDSSPLKFFNTYFTEPFALSQVIEQPTRITNTSSTLIDLMLTSNPENVKVHGVVDTPGISDHCLIFCAYSLKKPKFKPRIVTKRDFRNFDEKSFLRDMEIAPWGNILAVDDNDIDNKVTIFENIHREIIDKHAPYRTFRVTRPASPWLNDEIKNLMDNRDKYKNKFNKDKKSETEDIYKFLRNKVSYAIRTAKIKMFNENVNAKVKNAKQFHQALKNFSIVENNKNNSHICNFEPDLLNQSFIKNNNAQINEELVSDEVNEILKKSVNPTFSFSEVTEEQVIRVVRSIKTNACGVDCISAFFLKLGIEHSVFAFTNIINSSFLYNNFPTRWKSALVKPLPKNNNPSCLTDYRPISLLPSFSKVIEKLVCKQMIEYLKDTNYFDSLQSAYKQSHSTITALLNVTDDIYEALENSELVFLVLLDYSKAFDCANHKLILAKLKAAGFGGDSLSWVSSYLSGRRQKVVTTNNESSWQNVLNGVPQGSVLGPLLFTVLVSDLRDAIKRGRYHMYADDTQLYYTCKCEDANITIDDINTV